MAGRVVRSSKFRHVFGTVEKKENCYDDLKITRNAWDSNYITANAVAFAVILEAAGGGAFAVIPNALKGKINPNTPIITGHKSPVLDLDWNPFNDYLVASASEDCTAKIWGIPEGGLTANMTEPLQTLNGHKRKVGTVQFNPVANNILATSSTDFTVKIWDIEKAAAVLTVEAAASDLINSVDWNNNGSLLATASKDKKLRVVDPRQQAVAGEVEAHLGIKAPRCLWLGKKETIFTIGFTKSSEREYCLWDPRQIAQPLTRQTLDSASGLLMPFFDKDTNILFLAGKGDGNIRYFEVVDEAPYVHFLSEFKSNTPQRGMCMVPKRALNVSECEIVRLMKVGVSKVEPISFQVPRKSDVFQDDIFPDCFSGDFALTAAEWLNGKNAEPRIASLATGFVQKERPAVSFNPEKVEVKVLNEKEMQAEIEKLGNRVSYLEAELVKRDIRIKELGGQ